MFLEASGERMVDVIEPERAYGRAHQARSGRGENSVEMRVVTWHFINALCGRGKRRVKNVFIIISYGDGRNSQNLIPFIIIIIVLENFNTPRNEDSTDIIIITPA